MNRHTEWHNDLPEHTKKYFQSQAIWHDRDMIYSCLLGFVVGVIIGIASCI